MAFRLLSRQFIVTILCVILSVISGLLSGDLLIGGTALATGLLCSYFTGEGKRAGPILGVINYTLIALVSFWNHLYGSAFICAFISVPMMLVNFFTWGKHMDKTDTVKVREFTPFISRLVIFSCIAGSFLLAYILSLIPTQRLNFLDAASNSINICGMVLMALRFKESWWIWLANNIIDFSIWTITFVQGGTNSFMMFLTALGYLLLNIYGIIKWTLMAKRKEQK